MELKTKVLAESGKQELHITRDFDLPVDLLFRAYTDPGIVEQWMGTKVLKLENKKHGSYLFETTDEHGNIVFKANGAIHEYSPDSKITRTFETCLPAGKVENSPFAVQLEFLEFEKLTEETSKLNIHIVFRSVDLRDQLLKMPFAQGINMAHNRLEKIVANLKTVHHETES